MPVLQCCLIAGGQNGQFTIRNGKLQKKETLKSPKHYKSMHSRGQTCLKETKFFGTRFLAPNGPFLHLHRSPLITTPLGWQEIIAISGVLVYPKHLNWLL